MSISLRRWFDSAAEPVTSVEGATDGDRIDWLRAAPFVAMHLACLAVFWVGVSRLALEVAVGLYVLRMFALTGFYHRYFAHRTFKTSRVVQFTFACIGASCVQRGPLWWAAHHRNHHMTADTEADPHSPQVHGFLWSHMGWFLTSNGFRTHWKRIPDLARYPELRWLDRYDILVPIALAAALFGLGSLLAHVAPQSGVTGGQLLVWGFFVSTIVLFHATVTINSLAHRFGTRRFDTRDDSRNNIWLALLTFGEGWHNNHHAFPFSARHGLRWYEIDLTWWHVRTLAFLRLADRVKIPSKAMQRLRQAAQPGSRSQLISDVGALS